MKNIYHKIFIHPLFYIVLGISFFTGNMNKMMLFMIIIIVHELGHIIVAIYLKWNIEKICIYPFGAVTKFKECLNRPIKEEIFIALSGPILQFIFFLIMHSYYKNETFYNFNISILLFNLLPMIPLDGSKIVELLLQKKISYYKSLKIINFISYVVCLFVIYFSIKISLIWILISVLFLYKIIDNFNKIEIIFMKFILERILYNFNFKKRKTIKNNIKKMKRDTLHIFNINNKYYTERQILQKKFANKFDFNYKSW